MEPPFRAQITNYTVHLTSADRKPTITAVKNASDALWGISPSDPLGVYVDYYHNGEAVKDESFFTGNPEENEFVFTPKWPVIPDNPQPIVPETAVVTLYIYWGGVVGTTQITLTL